MFSLQMSPFFRQLTRQWQCSFRECLPLTKLWWENQTKVNNSHLTDIIGEAVNRENIQHQEEVLTNLVTSLERQQPKNANSAGTFTVCCDRSVRALAALHLQLHGQHRGQQVSSRAANDPSFLDNLGEDAYKTREDTMLNVCLFKMVSRLEIGMLTQMS